MTLSLSFLFHFEGIPLEILACVVWKRGKNPKNVVWKLFFSADISKVYEAKTEIEDKFCYRNLYMVFL